MACKASPWRVSFFRSFALALDFAPEAGGSRMVATHGHGYRTSWRTGQIWFILCGSPCRMQVAPLQAVGDGFKKGLLSSLPLGVSQQTSRGSCAKPDSPCAQGKAGLIGPVTEHPAADTCGQQPRMSAFPRAGVGAAAAGWRLARSRENYGACQTSCHGRTIPSSPVVTSISSMPRLSGAHCASYRLHQTTWLISKGPWPFSTVPITFQGVAP